MVASVRLPVAVRNHQITISVSETAPVWRTPTVLAIAEMPRFNACLFAPTLAKIILSHDVALAPEPLDAELAIHPTLGCANRAAESLSDFQIPLDPLPPGRRVIITVHSLKQMPPLCEQAVESDILSTSHPHVDIAWGISDA